MTKARNNINNHGSAGSIWFMGFVGMLVYQLHVHSGSVKLVLIAFFKAFFWLAYLVYYVLKFMNV
ncbi:MAG: hypothetical protein WCO19_05025 [Candidatus Saccharibacteria bacterium]